MDINNNHDSQNEDNLIKIYLEASITCKIENLKSTPLSKSDINNESFSVK
jgi:hypothetical protein